MFFSSPYKKPTKARSCSGKSKMTEKVAKEKAKAIRWRGTNLYAYRCLYCKLRSGGSAWHIGHRSR